MGARVGGDPGRRARDRRRGRSGAIWGSAEIAGSIYARLPFVHAPARSAASRNRSCGRCACRVSCWARWREERSPSPGAAYQGTFRNPLADPYLLGAAAGAELGATLAIIFLPGQACWASTSSPWPRSSERRSRSPAPTSRAIDGRAAERHVVDPRGGRHRVVPDGDPDLRASNGTPTRSGRCTRGCSAGSRPRVGRASRSCRRTSRSAPSSWSPTGACWTSSSSATTRPPAWACALVACASGSWWRPRSGRPRSSPSAGRSRSSASSCRTPCGSWSAGAIAWSCRCPWRSGRRSSSSPTPWRAMAVAPAELPIGVITALIGAPFFVVVLRSTRTTT